MGGSLICEGLKDYGLKEVYGYKSNPKLLDIIKKSLPNAIDDSVVSWCGIWLKEVVSRVSCCIRIPEKFMVAREWLKVGVPVEIQDIRQGDVLVFWRDNERSWKGHVGIYVGETESYYNVLGGNQGDKVSISGYKKIRLLGARRLI